MDRAGEGGWGLAGNFLRLRESHAEEARARFRGRDKGARHIRCRNRGRIPRHIPGLPDQQIGTGLDEARAPGGMEETDFDRLSLHGHGGQLITD